MTTIKRYSNRKLYDSLTRRYVTLEEIGWMVQNGEDVTVVDHDSGADITAVTLTQVIFDQEKRMGGRLPQAVFSRIIKTREAGLSILRRGVDSLLDPDEHVNREIIGRLDILHNEGSLADSEFDRLKHLLLDERFDRVEDDFTPPVSSENLETLQAQLKMLEIELESIRQKKQGASNTE
jgi:polyhydroxyalkanoate synthesis repressor PhaR